MLLHMASITHRKAAEYLRTSEGEKMGFHTLQKIVNPAITYR